jgi:hypothetical protein
VCEHIWVKDCTALSWLELRPGDQIAITAIVEMYQKNYQGLHDEDFDYGLIVERAHIIKRALPAPIVER